MLYSIETQVLGLQNIKVKMSKIGQFFDDGKVKCLYVQYLGYYINSVRRFGNDRDGLVLQ